jgi:hypothetical protein
MGHGLAIYTLIISRRKGVATKHQKIRHLKTQIEVDFSPEIAYKSTNTGHLTPKSIHIN